MSNEPNFISMKSSVIVLVLLLVFGCSEEKIPSTGNLKGSWELSRNEYILDNSSLVLLTDDDRLIFNLIPEEED